MQQDVWKAIGQVARELDIQVFATTHSLRNDSKPPMTPSRKMTISKSSASTDYTVDARLVKSRRNYNNELDLLNAVATFDFDYEVRG